MRFYDDFLGENGHSVVYIENHLKITLERVFEEVHEQGIGSVRMADVTDHVLEERIRVLARKEEERRSNFWGRRRRIPPSFYSGTTGLSPVDSSIRTVLSHAFTHHIERLMVHGNIMCLCEISPDEIYRWFMEFFIDAYDWVMVPDVYGMSQYADGGVMSTKPYISGSDYLLRMNDIPKGAWCTIWDGLFWRFIEKNRGKIEGNYRMKLILSNLDKKSEEVISAHLTVAEEYLRTLGEKEIGQVQ